VTKTEELKTALAAKGLRYVGTRGSPGAPICLVGEAPGADEDQQGIPFCGASGRELDRMLSEAGIRGDSCWWTNPYKTRPPDNKIDRLSELGLPLTLFHDQFWEELNAFKPTFIVPLGATPLGLLCPFTISQRTGHAEISKYRGSILRCDTLPWEHYVVPAFHPAFIFRAWEERQIDILCLARVAEEYNWWRTHSNQLQPLPQRKLISDPPADDAIDYLRSILASPPSTVVSIDIENIGVYRGKHKVKQRNRVPYVVGFSIDPLLGMSIGLAEYEKEKTAEVWNLINQVLQRATQVGQNYYTHDLPWLQYLGFSPNLQLVHDTLVRHHTLWPELSHKLDFQTFQYTREPYYKDEGKDWSVKDRQKMKRYNCKDVCVTLEVYQRQEEEFAARGIAA
jgi:uracil-DNA glycosylase family 4